jgi:hypothetical protein
MKISFTKYLKYIRKINCHSIMDTVVLHVEGYNFSFLNVEFHTVFATPLSYCINATWRTLQSSAYFMFRQIFRSSANKRNLEWFILSERSLIKLLNKRDPSVEPWGTPDNTEKGEENLTKIWTKEDLFDK